MTPPIINLSSRVFALPDSSLRLDAEGLRLLDTVKQKRRVAEGVWAFPFEERTVQMVRQFSGVYVPAPIEELYDWPIEQGWKPMSHQIDIAQFLTTHRRAFNLSGIGTGKTKSTFWALDYLMSNGDIRKALIVAPKSTISYVWGREIYKNYRRRRVAVLTGPVKKRVHDLRNSGADVVVANHDALRHMHEYLATAGFDAFVIDESTAIKTYSAARSKAFRDIVKRAGDPFVWLLSGAPMPQSPMDMYGQAKVVCPDRIPPTKSAFEDETMYRINPMIVKPRPGAEEKIYKWIAPCSIRYALEDCEDIPPTHFVPVDVEQTEQQRTIIADMLTKAEHELAEGKITAVNAAAKLNKILQVAAGAVIYTDSHNERDAVFIDCDPRFDALDDMLDASTDPFLVFTPWIATMRRVREWLEKSGRKFVFVNGNTPDRERLAAFDAVQAGECDGLLANADTMAHGITLTRAHQMLWWGYSPRVETYIQTIGRVRRKGQTKKQNVFNLFSTEQERVMYAGIQGGISAQETLLDMIRRQHAK